MNIRIFVRSYLMKGSRKFGMWAFWQCTSLESVALPSSVTEINERAFGDCSNLREVVFNEGLENTGMGAFGQCTSLESVVLPSSNTIIHTLAFDDCSNLREITLNNGLQKIGMKAFCHCTSLEKLYYHLRLIILMNTSLDNAAR